MFISDVGLSFIAWLKFRQKGWSAAMRLDQRSMGQTIVPSVRMVVHQSTNIRMGSQLQRKVGGTGKVTSVHSPPTLRHWLRV